MNSVGDERAPAALEGRELSKRYGATQALDRVSIRLERGQVTALAGGNGAGKSTLIRLLTGVERPDQGLLLRDGVPLRLHAPEDATKAGIFCVYQDQPFVEVFDVSQQMYMGYEQHFRKRGIISAGLMRRSCAELLGELGLRSVAPTDSMRLLSPAAREVVALASVVGISRLLGVQHPVIMLDEPTSALSAEELDFLFDFLESLKSRSALMFVSHRVTEVIGWSDAIYILRDGRDSDFMTRGTASETRVHHAMGGYVTQAGPGASRERQKGEARAATGACPALALQEVRLHLHANSFDFSVNAGEIVGLAGVEGSGKEELLRLCGGIGVGAGPSYSRMEVDGAKRGGRLRELLRSGVVYLSGDRQKDGIFGTLSVAENVAVTRRVAGEGNSFLVRRKKEEARAEGIVKRLSVVTRGVKAPLQSLSGGNQQKVLVGRCLELAPRVMLLDNVTRGVDVGAKAIIHGVLRDLAADGVAIILASNDLEELTAVADRIVVFKGGSLVRELDNLTQAVESVEVLAAMV